jgi:NAD(P)-dependent dehydrogenase (short-subunit alcohol dehydrogenase family)
MKKLQNKIALITGASRGLGAAIARKYIDEGAHVIAVARTVKELELLDDYARERGSFITIVPLDLQDFTKIDELGYIVAQKFGRLDILVANAGIIGVLTPITHMKPEMWQQIMNVNLTANWRLLRSMDVLLRNAQAAQVIFVTDSVGPKAYWGAYAVSKAALEAMAQIYQQEAEISGVKVHVISPPPVATKLRATVMPGEEVETLPQPNEVIELFVVA